MWYLAKIVQGQRRNGSCMWLTLVMSAVFILWVTQAVADIYRYVDDDRIIHYTDDIDRVPAKYRDIVQHQKALDWEGSSEPYMRQPQPLAGEFVDDKPGNSISPGEGPGDEIQKPSAASEEELRIEAEEGAGGERGTQVSTVIRRQLEQESRSLHLQKEALANNRAYQKKKLKRRYKNRHHIKELMEKEARIDARLTEIEKELRQTD